MELPPPFAQMRWKAPRGVGVPDGRAHLFGDPADLLAGRGGQRGHSRGQPAPLPGTPHGEGAAVHGHGPLLLPLHRHGGPGMLFSALVKFTLVTAC